MKKKKEMEKETPKKGTERTTSEGAGDVHVCGYVLHLSCIIFDVDNIASVVVLARQFMVRGFYKDTRSTSSFSSTVDDG